MKLIISFLKISIIRSLIGKIKKKLEQYNINFEKIKPIQSSL